MKITEFKKYEARHVLLESLDRESKNTYLVWENVGYQLKEAALSPQQIQGLFAEIEKTATAAGSNRTGIGQAKDKIDQVIMKPYNDLKAKIYNSGPMQGFAEKYDAAAEKLKQSAGGDEGRVMQAVKKYRQFAEKHPIMQGFLYAALIAAAGVSGAGLGGAAALGLFKLTDQLLQGKDIRSALYSAGKTGALAAGASTLGDLVRGGGDAAGGFSGDAAGGAVDGTQQGGFAGGGNSIDGRPDINVDAQTGADMRAAGIQDIAGATSIDDIVADFDGKLSTAEMNMIQDLPNQDGIPQNVIDQYNAQLGPMYDPNGLNLADFKPGQQLTNDQMQGLLDLPNQDNIPDDVVDQYNRQLQSFVDGDPFDQSGDIATVDGAGSAELDAAGNPVAGDDIDPEDIRGSSGADFSKNAQGGSVADNIEQRKAELRAKADEFLPGGGKAEIVRGNIPIYDPDQAAEFKRLFPGTEAMGAEAKEWLKTNVDGAAEKFDQAAASQAERLKNLSPEQLARRKALLQSGHSTADALTEDQIQKLFIACAYRQNLMEAPGGMLSNLKTQIGKGVTKLGQKARQVGTNITTKVTADKLMKAWNKAGKPTDSVQIATWLTGTQGVNPAVMQQAFQTAGIKMPDLKKIASNDPVMALAKKINSNPAIKKQVMQYLNAVT